MGPYTEILPALFRQDKLVPCQPPSIMALFERGGVVGYQSHRALKFVGRKESVVEVPAAA